MKIEDSNKHLNRKFNTGIQAIEVILYLLSVSQSEAQLQPATRIPLQTNHTETPTHIEPRTIQPMW